MRTWIVTAVVALAVSFLAVTGARGDVFVVGTQTDTSPIAFSEVGTFVDAGNFNDPTPGAPNYTSGTNDFAPKQLIGNPAAQVFPGNNGVSVTLSASSGVLEKADLRRDSFTDELWFTEIYTFTQTDTETLTIAGLNPLKTYLIQFPHGESRSGPDSVPYFGTQTFTDGNGDTSHLEFGGPNFDPYALITVQVSNSATLSYAMPQSDIPPGLRGASMNGYTIREVPEPHTGILLAGAAMLARRRRRSSPCLRPPLPQGLRGFRPACWTSSVGAA